MKPIFVNVGACVMLEDNTLVKCVEDKHESKYGIESSCSVCCLGYECIKFTCDGLNRSDGKPVHFEIVPNTCDHCGTKTQPGDAYCESCKITELSENKSKA
jgi:hypothetical protein